MRFRLKNPQNECLDEHTPVQTLILRQRRFWVMMRLYRIITQNRLFTEIFF
jgi:hypothetical protein